MTPPPEPAPAAGTATQAASRRGEGKLARILAMVAAVTACLFGPEWVLDAVRSGVAWAGVGALVIGAGLLAAKGRLPVPRSVRAWLLTGLASVALILGAVVGLGTATLLALTQQGASLAAAAVLVWFAAIGLNAAEAARSYRWARRLLMARQALWGAGALLLLPLAALRLGDVALAAIAQALAGSAFAGIAPGARLVAAGLALGVGGVLAWHTPRWLAAARLDGRLSASAASETLWFAGLAALLLPLVAPHLPQAFAPLERAAAVAGAGNVAAGAAATAAAVVPGIAWGDTALRVLCVVLAHGAVRLLLGGARSAPPVPLLVLADTGAAAGPVPPALQALLAALPRAWGVGPVCRVLPPERAHDEAGAHLYLALQARHAARLFPVTAAALGAVAASLPLPQRWRALPVQELYVERARWPDLLQALVTPQSAVLWIDARDKDEVAADPDPLMDEARQVMASVAGNAGDHAGNNAGVAVALGVAAGVARLFDRPMPAAAPAQVAAAPPGRTLRLHYGVGDGAADARFVPVHTMDLSDLQHRHVPWAAGDVPGLAARLQELVQPGPARRIVIAHAREDRAFAAALVAALDGRHDAAGRFVQAWRVGEGSGIEWDMPLDAFRVLGQVQLHALWREARQLGPGRGLAKRVRAAWGGWLIGMSPVDAPAPYELVWLLSEPMHRAAARWQREEIAQPLIDGAVRRIGVWLDTGLEPIGRLDAQLVATGAADMSRARAQREFALGRLSSELLEEAWVALAGAAEEAAPDDAVPPDAEAEAPTPPDAGSIPPAESASPTAARAEPAAAQDAAPAAGDRAPAAESAAPGAVPATGAVPARILVLVPPGEAFAVPDASGTSGTSGAPESRTTAAAQRLVDELHRRGAQAAVYALDDPMARSLAGRTTMDAALLLTGLASLRLRPMAQAMAFLDEARQAGLPVFRAAVELTPLPPSMQGLQWVGPADASGGEAALPQPSLTTRRAANGPEPFAATASRLLAALATASPGPSPASGAAPPPVPVAPAGTLPGDAAPRDDAPAATPLEENSAVPVHTLAVLGDDSRVAGRADGRLDWSALQPRGERLRQQIAALDGPVRALCAVGAAGLAAAGDDGRLLLWDRLPPATPPRVLQGGGSGVLALTCVGGRWLVSAAQEGSLQWWPHQGNEPPVLQRGVGAPALSMQADPHTGDLLLAAGAEGWWRIAGPGAPPMPQMLPTELSSPNVALLRVDGTAIHLGGHDAVSGQGFVCRLALNARAAEPHRLLSGLGAPVTAAAVIPGGRLAIGLADGVVAVWSPDSSAPGVGALATLSRRIGAVHALAWLPEGVLLSAADDGLNAHDVPIGAGPTQA